MVSRPVYHVNAPGKAPQGVGVRRAARGGSTHMWRAPTRYSAYDGSAAWVAWVWRWQRAAPYVVPSESWRHRALYAGLPAPMAIRQSLVSEPRTGASLNESERR